MILNKRVKIFAFVKDDHYLLSTWIPHHAEIVGIENLYIIDHNSGRDCQNFYKQYIDIGLNVRVVNCSFREKGIKLTQWMKEVGGDADLLMALDSDEFIICKDENFNIYCDTEKIIKVINDLERGLAKYSFFITTVPSVHYNLTDPLIELTDIRKPFFPQLNHGNKTFFSSKTFISTDEGNHCGRTTVDNGIYNKTDLGMIHFSHRGFFHVASKAIRGKRQMNFDKKFVPVAGEWRKSYNALLDGSLEKKYSKRTIEPPKNTIFLERVKNLRRKEVESGRKIITSETWDHTKKVIEDMKRFPEKYPRAIIRR